MIKAKLHANQMLHIYIDWMYTRIVEKEIVSDYAYSSGERSCVDIHMHGINTFECLRNTYVHAVFFSLFLNLTFP